jgi:hypothetical protein
MSGAIPPLLQYAFMAWCLVEKQGLTLPLPLQVIFKPMWKPMFNYSLYRTISYPHFNGRRNC